MAEPSYHLSAVVKSKDDYEDFTGPLDVILMLLSKNKIEIRDIQISLLLEQYLAWLEEQKELDMDIASEFVQMASQLTYIKTRMLLTSDTEEISELSELVEKLEKLQDRDTLAAIRQVSPLLGERSAEGLRLHTREPSGVGGVRREYKFTPEDLLSAMGGMLLRGEESRTAQENRLMKAIPQPFVYGIQEKSRELTELVGLKKTVPLLQLYELCESRSELVATLLSLLELCHDGIMYLCREGENWIVRSGAFPGVSYGTE